MVHVAIDRRAVGDSVPSSDRIPKIGHDVVVGKLWRIQDRVGHWNHVAAAEHLPFPPAGSFEHVELHVARGEPLGHSRIGIGLRDLNPLDPRAGCFLPSAGQRPEHIDVESGVAQPLKDDRLPLERALLVGVEHQLTDPLDVGFARGPLARSRNRQYLVLDTILREGTL